jgi:adenine deaminase
MGSFKLCGQLVDIPNREIFSAEIEVDENELVPLKRSIRTIICPTSCPAL